MTITYVYYMPKTLEPDVLYISKVFGSVQHLCPCGCGLVVHLPIWGNGWRLIEKESGVTLSPSIYHRQDCKSHYFIQDNQVVWVP